MKTRQITPEIIRVQFSPDGRGAVCTLADHKQVACPAHVVGRDHLVAVATGSGKAFARLDGRTIGFIWDRPQVETTWEESDISQAEEMADLGRLFERIHALPCPGKPGEYVQVCNCSGCSPSWKAWKASTDSQWKRSMETRNKAGKLKTKFAGKTPAEIVSELRADARQEHDDDAYGQSSENEILLALARAAMAAGLPVAELISECEIEDADERELYRQRAVEFAALAAEREAKIAPHRAAARIARESVWSYAASQIPDVDRIAEAIADGKNGAVAALEMAEARKLQEGPETPDTFGFCHGTDFNGGQW